MIEESVANGDSAPQSEKASDETPDVESSDESSTGAPGHQDAPPSNPAE